MIIEWEWPDDAVGIGLLIGICTVYAAAAVFIIVQCIRLGRAGPRARVVDTLSRRANLPVAGPLRPALERYAVARTRGSLLGVLVALPVILVVVQPWQPSFGTGLASTVLPFAFAFAAGLLGSIVGGLLARRSDAPATRTARLTEVGVTDLVAPVERRLALLCSIGGLLGVSLLALGAAAPWSTVPEPLLAGLPLTVTVVLATLALFLLLPSLTRKLVAARALTGDHHALAWSDALAAQTARDAHYLVVAVGGMTALNAGMSLALALPEEWTVARNLWINGSFYACLILVTVVFVLVATRQPGRHVQRTLWPQLAADAQ